MEHHAHHGRRPGGGRRATLGGLAVAAGVAAVTVRTARRLEAGIALALADPHLASPRPRPEAGHHLWP